jgi:hypothetical protein
MRGVYNVNMSGKASASYHHGDLRNALLASAREALDNGRRRGLR